MTYALVDAIKPEAVEMRATFARVMDELAAQDPRVIYLDCDVINSIGMTPYSVKYADRALDCGIQEANMIGVAAGMSATGLIPFTHTFGSFAARRVIDQVYISAAYAKLNIRMIGSDPGVTAAYNGGTHMPIEDMGLLRTIPGVTVLEPVDSVMLADMLRQTKDMFGVFYLRLSRKVADQIYAEGSTFTIGKATTLRTGSDVTIFATGICVADALHAADTLAGEGIAAAVSNMFTIKPVDAEAVIAAAAHTGAIVTAENHSIVNGLGSAVAEVVVEHCPVPVERVGVRDRFGEVGDVTYLKKTLGITADDIAAAARRAVHRKQR